MMDKMTGKDRDESKDFQFEVMGKLNQFLMLIRWILKDEF